MTDKYKDTPDRMQYFTILVERCLDNDQMDFHTKPLLTETDARTSIEEAVNAGNYVIVRTHFELAGNTEMTLKAED